jgi:ankyrin repeat protein
MWWKLYYEIMDNNVAKVIGILEKEPEIANSKGTGMHKNSTLLHIAARENRFEIGAIIIKYMEKETFFIRDTLEEAALHIAAKKGNLDLCKLIFEKAPELVNWSNLLNHTPLALAAEKGHSEVGCFLVEQMDHRFLSARENLTKSYAAIHYAAQNGLTEVCKKIVEKSPDRLYSRTEAEETVLHLAAEKGHFSTCEFFIQKDPGMLLLKSYWKMIPLHKAAKNGHTAICKLMLEINPKIIYAKIGLPCEQTAVDLAAEYGKTGTMIFLLEFTQLKKTLQQDELISILHYAACSGNLSACQYILDKYPDLANLKSRKLPQTALHIAAEKGHKDTCIFLISKMSKEAIDAVDFCGRTALFVVGEKRNFDICQLLLPFMSLEAIHKKDNYGKTAFDDIKSREMFYGSRTELYEAKRSVLEYIKSHPLPNNKISQDQHTIQPMGNEGINVAIEGNQWLD